MADRARFLNGRDDGHLTQRRQRRRQRPNPLRVHAIIIGYKNARHWNQ